MRKSLIGVAALVLLGGCSAGADVATGEREIASFHEALNRGQLATIYDSADPTFRQSAKRDEFEQLLSAIQRKLGPFQSGKTQTWNDNVTTGGHYVTISYAASYSRGGAQENFVYRLVDGRARLAGYHVNSTALIVN
jgi:hypothetical protein